MPVELDGGDPRRGDVLGVELDAVALRRGDRVPQGARAGRPALRLERGGHGEQQRDESEDPVHGIGRRFARGEGFRVRRARR
jgi:hypothetical protein